MVKQSDYYHILQLPADASPAEIKARYRSLMQKLHPDLGGNQADAALLNQAYAVLSDPAKRKQYDALLLRARQVTRRPIQTSRQSSAQPSSAQPSSSQQATKVPPGKEKCLCAFCNKVNFIAREQPATAELFCQICQSPLQFIGFDPNWIGQRAPRSAKWDLDIQFRVKSGPSAQHNGKVINLSPTGMLLSAVFKLKMGDIIKLDNGELSAVGMVMRCEREQNNHVAGIKFLALKVHRAQGTFVSQKV